MCNRPFVRFRRIVVSRLNRAVAEAVQPATSHVDRFRLWLTFLQLPFIFANQFENFTDLLLGQLNPVVNTLRFNYFNSQFIRGNFTYQVRRKRLDDTVGLGSPKRRPNHVVRPNLAVCHAGKHRGDHMRQLRLHRRELSMQA